MVDPVTNAGVADTLESRLADARNRHADGEYGTIPLLIVELGIRSQWATEHPSRPDSPRPVRNEGGVDNEVDGGARVSGNDGTKHRGVLKVDGGVDRSQARVQKSTAATGSSRADVDGRVCSSLRSRGGLSATTHVTLGGIASTYGYFKFSPDRITVAPLQGRRDLITWRESIEPQLEVAGLKGFTDGTVPIPPVDDVGLRGEFRAAHLLTFMVISSYILQDEAMQEAEQPTELLPQANYAALTKLNPQQGQRKMHGGGGSGGGWSTKDVDEKRSTRGKSRGGDGRRRECSICHDPDHLSYECPNRDESDEDDTKGGHGRSTSSRPRRNEMPRKEKQTSKKTSLTKDIDHSSGKSRGDEEASARWSAWKSDVLREFKKWLLLVERQTKKSVLMLCSDRGGEFLGKEFTEFVDGKGIVHNLTCPYTPQQNGMAEREMRTNVDSMRTMLLHMGVQHH
ncbi:unnamed protein product [Closterium sp. NIES-54]